LLIEGLNEVGSRLMNYIGPSRSGVEIFIALVEVICVSGTTNVSGSTSASEGARTGGHGSVAAELVGPACYVVLGAASRADTVHATTLTDVSFVAVTWPANCTRVDWISAPCGDCLCGGNSVL